MGFVIGDRPNLGRLYYGVRSTQGGKFDESDERELDKQRAYPPSFQQSWPRVTLPRSTCQESYIQFATIGLVLSDPGFTLTYYDGMEWYYVVG